MCDVNSDVKSAKKLVEEIHASPWGFPGGDNGKRICLPKQEIQEMQVQSLGWEDPWRREWQPIPVFLPGESHGQKSLMGYSP